MTNQETRIPVAVLWMTVTLGSFIGVVLVRWLNIAHPPILGTLVIGQVGMYPLLVITAIRRRRA